MKRIASVILVLSLEDSATFEAPCARRDHYLRRLSVVSFHAELDRDKALCFYWVLHPVERYVRNKPSH